VSLSTQFLDELRERTSLSGLIGRSVKLIRAGREWKACCPFHQEKTPSFTVNDDKSFYHCFGCGAHGDAIRFLTEVRGLPFIEAVKELADAAGMEMPAPDPRAREKADRSEGLREAMESAAAWFRERLGAAEGARARDYLAARGIGAAAIARFGIGFAPDTRTGLKTALARFGTERLIEAGVLVAPDEDGREPYDRFRGRLMFPIRDGRGRTIAFGGRILGEGEPKYLNSPETPLFDKGRVLFNLDLASTAARAAGRALVVEGYMDVVALSEVGVPEALAPLGTALTPAQLALLWRLAEVPILCFDGDAAGEKAAIRAALRALPHVGAGRSLAFAALPPGQDPDDLVRSGGREALEKVLAAAEPLVDRLWRHEANAAPLTTPEQRAALRRRLSEHVSAIEDADVRALYRREMLDRFDAFASPRRKGSEPRFTRMFARPRRSVGPGTSNQAARAVLAGLVKYPEAIAASAEAIAALPLTGREATELRAVLLDAAMDEACLDRARLDAILGDRGLADFAERLGRERGLAFSFSRRDAEPERACRDLVLVLETLASAPGLAAALDAATARLKESGDDAAFQEQQRLRKARAEVDGRLMALIESDGG